MSTNNNLLQAFAQTERWSDLSLAAGGYVMTDPLSGDKLDPNTPPSWIAEDPQHGAGLDFLRARAGDVALHLAFGKQSEIEDLDLGEDSNGDWFEREVKTADYYGFAAFAYEEAALEQSIFVGVQMDINSVQRGGDIVAFLEEAQASEVEMTEYDLRILRAIAQNYSKTHSFSYDLAVDGTPVEQAILHGMDVMTALPTTPESAIALAGLENAAEWCGLAKTGLVMQLSELARPRRNDIKGFETMGGARSDARRKYSTLGIQPRATLINSETWARGDARYRQ